MALEPCRECGTEVSTKALKCPQCATPNPTMSEGKQKTASTVAVIGCLLPFALVFLLFLFLLL